MSLSCSCPDYEPGEGEWYWVDKILVKMPPLGRRQRCRCCGDIIGWGEDVFKFVRFREALYDVEYYIYGDEVPLPHWYTCEECSDLISAVEDLGFCWTFGTPIKDQIQEYREAERLWKIHQNQAEKYGWTIEDYM